MTIPYAEVYRRALEWRAPTMKDIGTLSHWRQMRAFWYASRAYWRKWAIKYPSGSATNMDLATREIAVATAEIERLQKVEG